MVKIEQLKEYLNLTPDDDSNIAELALKAAKSKARVAGIPNFQNNAMYDLFLCALAGFWNDNRNLGFIGSGNRGTANAEANSRALINSFVLELRYAKEDDGSDPPDWSTEDETTDDTEVVP